MNIKKVINYIGSMVKLEAILMLFPFIVSLIYKESTGKYFILLSIVYYLIGFILQKVFVSDDRFYTAEGFVTASLGWIVLSIFGCLPFFLSKEIPSFVDALFETVSGFTTTGATILDDVTAVSHCMNFWRCFTHFVGGMGILVLMLAIIPTSSETMQIMKAESPGPQVGKLVPKVSDTARMLYIIYISLTIITIIAYLLSGMPLFDSICIGFGTAGTGGFVITKNGCADYGYLSQTLIAIFMIIFGVNFNIYFLIVQRKLKIALRSEEVITYLSIIIVSCILIHINILSIFKSISITMHNVLFHVASIITTTGFAINDYTIWPVLSRLVLLALMVVGGCAGSTAGGFKVSRFIILVKASLKEIYLQLHPSSVKVIKFEGKVVPDDVTRNTFSYAILYFLIIAFSILLISFNNFSFETTVSSVFETFNNVGLGLDQIGPKGNFSIFSNFSKIIFIILMLTGRLEIFPVLMLLSGKTWRRES